MRFDGWSWAALFARWFLGLMFLMSGVWKVFDLGVTEHARRFFVAGYGDSWIPESFLWALGVVIPFIELIAGALVCLGLRLREALIALGALLVVVTYGHLLAEPLFDATTHVFPRLVLLIFVLMVPRDRDVFSLDYWMGERYG
jgi:uncharacterized membrane protein YphA (DoxX/SURF4 family)